MPTKLLIAVIVIKVKKETAIKCLKEEWLNALWYIHTMKYSVAIKIFWKKFNCSGKGLKNNIKRKNWWYKSVYTVWLSPSLSVIYTHTHTIYVNLCMDLYLCMHMSIYIYTLTERESEEKLNKPKC